MIIRLMSMEPRCSVERFGFLNSHRSMPSSFIPNFRGRKDVYVKRSSKKGYYTQCNNFWKYGVCPKTRGVGQDFIGVNQK